MTDRKKRPWIAPLCRQMSAGTVKAIRRALGLTQFQLGRELYLKGDEPDHPIRDWENGRKEITGPAQRALELLAEKHNINLNQEG